MARAFGYRILHLLRAWLVSCWLLGQVAQVRAEDFGERTRVAIAQVGSSHALLREGRSQAAQATLASVSSLVAGLRQAGAVHRRDAEREQRRCIERVGSLELKMGELFAQENRTKEQIASLEAELTKATADYSLSDAEVRTLGGHITEARAKALEHERRLQELARWWWVPGYGQYLAIRTLVDDDIGKHRSLTHTLHDKRVALQHRKTALHAAQAIMCEALDQQESLERTSPALACMRRRVHQRLTELKQMTVFLLDSESFWKRLERLATISVDGNLQDLELLYAALHESREALPFVEDAIADQTKTLEELLIELADSLDTDANLLLQNPVDYCVLEESAGPCGESGSSRPAAPSVGVRLSSFQYSCEEVTIVDATVRARCRNRQNKLVDASLVLQRVANLQGNLMLDGSNTESSFQRSCSSSIMCGSLLRSRCGKGDGTRMQTSLRVEGIHNMDGRLTY
jgi:hypothetical protein